MRIYSTTTLIVSFISLFFISFNVNSAEVSEAVKACNAAVNKGDATSGLAQAEAILKSNSTDYEGLLCKGRALGLQGQYPEALATMEQAEQATQDVFAKTVVYILIGNLHQSQNQTEKAVASYQKSIEQCVKNDNITYKRMNYNLIGDAYFKASDLNAALENYLISTRLANNDNERAESFERLAKTYNAQGNHDKAIEFQLKATVMQKQAGSLTAYADSTLLLGQYFYDAKEYSQAERTYKRLAKFAKDNGGAYYEAKANYRLAEAMHANGDKAAAKTLLGEAASLANKIGAKQLASEIDATQKKLNI